MTSHLDVLSLYEGIRNGSRRCLAQAITLIESTTNRTAAHELLALIAPYTGKSIKVGFTGLPGSGKSTLLNEIGLTLCQTGARVAVLTIDPTSEISGGSILGDKTRMAQLGAHPHSFIRPSPSKRDLGGVHRRTCETMMLCEAAGYTHILIETVGIGQSEGDIRNLVDVLVLTLITGAGDDLQGVKRGILELADVVVFNKADGANEQRAIREAQRFQRYLRYFSPYTSGWKPTSLAVSAMKPETLAILWRTIKDCADIRTTIPPTERSAQLHRRFVRTLYRELVDLIVSIPQAGELVEGAFNRVNQGDSLAEIEAYTTAQEILLLLKGMK